MISSLNISDTVELCITDKVLQKHYYKTKIQDIGLNDVLYTMIPSSETGRPVMFFKEQVYELFAKGPEGIVVWNVTYLGVEKIDNLSSCKFKAIDGPRVTQRREFYRQPVSIDAKFYIIGSDSYFDPEVQIEGRIIDLSGGGCAFMCDASITLHSRLIMSFTFRNYDFQFYGEILDRIDYTNTRSDWNYKYRLKWVDTTERIIDRLIMLVFEQQRELLIANSSRGGDRFV